MAFSSSYVSGLFDGEGCIHIGRRKRGIWLPQFHLQVSISMANPVLRSLAEFTGGYIQVIKRDLKIAGRRRVYTLSWTGNTARNFLASIYDELHVKQEEARLAIIFQDHMNAYKFQARYMGESELRDLVAYRERLRLQVKKCKSLMLIGATDWNVGEFGEHPMPGLKKDAEGQSRAKQAA